MTRTTAPYGTWKSPLTAAQITQGKPRLGAPQAVGEAVYWTELRPAESGRVVLIRKEGSSPATDAIPEGFNVRTRVHEYGGGAYLATPDALFFTNFDDQRLYRSVSGGEPIAITPEPKLPSGDRFADMRPFDLAGKRLVAVREVHHEDGSEATNEIVSLPSDGEGEQRVLVSGADFYAAPRVSPDGSKLAWLSWNHPLMPWDGTELWVGDITAEGTVANVRLVAGGDEESIFQPEWSPQGVLHFVSDRSGWWNIYREGNAESLAPMAAEFGQPLWVFGMATYTFLDDGRIVCMYFDGRENQLALIDPAQGGLSSLNAQRPPTGFGNLTSDGTVIYYISSGDAETPKLVQLDPQSGREEILAEGDEVDSDYVSKPRAIEFPTTNSRTGHAIFYPPANKEFEGPSDELPPLIVFTHGGPTAHVESGYNASLQYWTGRGFAVVDVNYGGSTGYGREYRNRLRGTWGIVDTEDCIAAAKYLASGGDVDGDRLAIRGGSAGGWTTLCALTFHDDFSAGANYFGVSDLKAFVADTHKFESRYLDSLIGPYPEKEQLYFDRSPTNFTEQIKAPMVIFQGLEDKIVPPSQSEIVVEALKKNGVPYAYFEFEGEQHGFRRAENLISSLEAELYFYGKVFGFDPADEIDPYEIVNLNQPSHLG